MSELLIELFSEEIPARMQTRAAADLAEAVTGALAAEGLGRAAGKEAGRKAAAGPGDGPALRTIASATPRRLMLVVEGLPAQSPTIVEERKGPRVGAPDAAIQGFLKGAGLARIEDARIVEDKKGSYYVATVEKRGRPAAEIIAAIMPGVLSRFPWPKSMRWGSSGATWVRPLHSIVCLLDGKVVPFEFGGVRSGNTTRGHRFHGNEPFAVASFEDYATKLKERKVLLLASERALMIREQAQEIAAKAKLRLVEDEGLLAENAGLAEWPVVMMGTFDPEFLEVPAECLTSSMRTHQKCFSLEDPRTGRLANRFLLVSNLIAADGGKTIVAGNEKVIRARLSDARFFWSQDLKRPLDEMASDLAGITFHEKLGAQKDRVERIAELAHEIAGAVDADPSDARRAAQLAKADLVSGMVGEFPELQGLMGRYYAEKAGTKPEIARAIELHYKPRGPADTVPREENGDAVAIAVALADKLDTLVGFWAIGEKPTGSGDPYQLRRAALGVIRVVLENDLRLPLDVTFAKTSSRLPQPIRLEDKAKADLLAFLAERLKVHLRDKGARHDLIDAVFALGGQYDLALIVKRVEALAELLGTEDGANLLAGARRAANIVAIEEKKDKRTYDGAPDPKLLGAPEEKALAAAIESVTMDTRKAIDVENFAGAMRALAELRAPVDAFFDKVTVNVDDKAVRENRLKLLARIRAATMTVADISRIAG